MLHGVESPRNVDANSDGAARRFIVVKSGGHHIDEREKRRRRRVKRFEAMLGGRSG